MDAKEKALNHIKIEKKWIVFYDRDGHSLDNIETTYHAFDTIEEAIDIAIEETKKELNTR